MKKFTSVHDIGDLKTALEKAKYVKENPFADQESGKNKTLLMIFFNSSLRTRLSTQKAALNLGMNVIVLDINQGAWKLETEKGVVMDGDKPEHMLEAIPVMGAYCDIIGVRSFITKSFWNSSSVIRGNRSSAWRRRHGIRCRVSPTLSRSRNSRRLPGRKWYSRGRLIPAHCRRRFLTRLPSG